MYQNEKHYVETPNGVTVDAQTLFALQKAGIRYEENEEARIGTGCDYYAETKELAEAAKAIFASGMSVSSLKDISPVLDEARLRLNGEARVLDGREIIGDPKFDWHSFLNDERSVVEIVETMKVYGLPFEEADRAAIVRKLRFHVPGEQIPVYYEDLLQYSVCFSKAYSAKVLLTAIKKYKIAGQDIPLEVKNAEALSGEERLPEDIGEAIMFAFPMESRKDVADIRTEEKRFEVCVELPNGQTEKMVVNDTCIENVTNKVLSQVQSGSKILYVTVYFTNQEEGKDEQDGLC